MMGPSWRRQPQQWHSWLADTTVSQAGAVGSGYTVQEQRRWGVKPIHFAQACLEDPTDATGAGRRMMVARDSLGGGAAMQTVAHGSRVVAYQVRNAKHKEEGCASD